MSDDLRYFEGRTIKARQLIARADELLAEPTRLATNVHEDFWNADRDAIIALLEAAVALVRRRP